VTQVEASQQINRPFLFETRKIMGAEITKGTAINPLTLNSHHSGRTALLTSRPGILNIYSTNICTEYFKHAT
jgi:hypothetical protein